MNKVERVRAIILGGIGSLVALVAVYSLLYVFDLIPGSDESGERYVVFDRDLVKDPIPVDEFFLFTCSVCRDLDDDLLSWSNELPDGVSFKQRHISSDQFSDVLAKTHVALDLAGALDQNRNRIFREVQDKQRQFLRIEELGDLVDGNGISRDEFLRMSEGRVAQRILSETQRLMVELQVTTVPYILVGNKYGVSTRGGLQETMRTVQFLVDEILAGNEPKDLSTDEAEEATESADVGSETPASS